jgi:hypothetical protein
MKNLHTYEEFLNESINEETLSITGHAYSIIKSIWNDKKIQRELNPLKFEIVGDANGVMTLSGDKKELDKVRDIFGLKESVVNEGQFSWMTHDTEKQIGSEKQNTITVYMFSDKGERWEEKRYEGYGEFGGKDYYELLAQMNGVENADRQDGIDIAFDKKKVKGKVLFPALVQDPKFNWKRHDFTQEAEHDPNQSWYKERSRGFY